ncbi:Alcohol dehydrogenase 4 [Cytospora mali]|uniref:Alcohol dehydrogenase 4 n=1 Tax=Cytospora mali TaxID=578113 RepID=A0A194UVY0_CYTMA|nr:Alcohol dehydrogenase 4 [Valsa mali var. pyri (nom. inval.)]
MPAKTRMQQFDIPIRKSHDAIFDASYLEDIPAQVQTWRSQRVLLVVSKALDSNTSVARNLEKSLGGLVVDKKAGVGSHSPYADVIDIAHRIQDQDVDCVISLGSSSYSDACKIARLLAESLPPGFGADDMEGLIDQEKGATPQDALKKPERVKLIVVPTSLSASEWNSVSSCTNYEGKKQHYGSWDFGAPDLILLDPRVAATSPERLWLSSGMRAIDHCVEIMCNDRSWEDDVKEVHVHTEKGLRCLLKGLKEYKEGKDKGDGSELLYGISECQYGAREAIMGLIVHRVPVGPSHAIGHQLGSVAGVLHGVTSCVMLAPVLRYTKDRSSKAQAKVLGIFNDSLGWQEEEAGDAVNRFVKMLGLPTTLSEVGVKTDEEVRKVTEKSMTDVWGGGKRQMEYDEVLEILNMVR